MTKATKYLDIVRFVLNQEKVLITSALKGYGEMYFKGALAYSIICSTSWRDVEAFIRIMRYIYGVIMRYTWSFYPL